MTQFYKIKVGIEEFEIEEKDIPRIVEAMKNNDMVKLECGVFRGNAILAVCRDEEREEKSRLIAFNSQTKTIEEIKIEEEKEIIKKQRLKCEICDHSGWKEELREDKVVRVPCDCTILPK